MGYNQQRRAIIRINNNPLEYLYSIQGGCFMRSYLENKEPSKWWFKPLKIITIIAISAAVMLILTLICSILILKTKMPESYEEFMMITVSAVTAMLMTILLTLNTKVKAIFAAAYSFLIIVIIKLILTAIMAQSISFGRQGIVGIIFTAVFCILGGLIAANIKK